MSEHAKIMTYFWRKSLDLFVVCKVIWILLCNCHFSSDCNWALLFSLIDANRLFYLIVIQISWLNSWKVCVWRNKNCRQDPYSHTFAFIGLKWHEPCTHVFSSYTVPWGQDVDLNINPKYLMVSEQFLNILSIKMWL